MVIQSDNLLGSRPWLWKPGESGNPAGRPPKPLSITSKIKEYLERDIDEIARVAVAQLKQPGKEYVALLKEVLDRVEGKVASEVNIKSVVMHIGDEYAQRGLAAIRTDLNDRKKAYSIDVTPEILPMPPTILTPESPPVCLPVPQGDVVDTKQVVVGEVDSDAPLDVTKYLDTRLFGKRA